MGLKDKNSSSNKRVSNKPGKKETKAIHDWQVAVKLAKLNVAKGEDSWGILSGAVLKEAMRCYCAMGY